VTASPASSIAPSTPVEVVQGLSDAAWDQYVTRHAGSTLYHLSAWREVFARTFRHETRYLAARCGETVIGVLPLVRFDSRLFGRFLVSLPFVNYGGILADSPLARDALLTAAIAEAQAAGSSHIELRHMRRFFPTLAVKSHKVVMRLPLKTSEAEQWLALDRKVRNQIRKADKCGLAVERGGAELLDAFYDVFAHNMRDLGTPVYSKRFFHEVLHRFPDHARVVCARHNGKPVAASITLHFREHMEVPWASSLRGSNHLSANVRLYWEMLRMAIESGLRTFDFGRSTPNEGTYHFKRQWGAQPFEVSWEYWQRHPGQLPNLTPKNPRFALLIGGWRRLPVGLTRALGPAIVRHLP
jgi:serine/alanine adding enzyme